MDRTEEETNAIINALPYKIPTSDNWDSIASFYHPLMAGSIDGTDIIPHDRAVVRAMRSKYRPNKKVVGDPKKTLMVRHLSPQTTERSLSHTFSRYGDLEKCRLIRDLISGFSRRYAFIEYKHESDARMAVRDTKELVIDDCKVTVDFECERVLPGWIPRRFGGGLGGKKESGQLRFGGCERPFRRPISLDSKRMGARQDFSTNIRGNNKREFHDVSQRSRVERTLHDSEKYPKRHKR